MPPVAVRIGPHPASLYTPPTDLTAEAFDPASFSPELLPDLDALAGSHKCACSASDDNPF